MKSVRSSRSFRKSTATDGSLTFLKASQVSKVCTASYLVVLPGETPVKRCLQWFNEHDITGAPVLETGTDKFLGIVNLEALIAYFVSRGATSGLLDAPVSAVLNETDQEPAVGVCADGNVLQLTELFASGHTQALVYVDPGEHELLGCIGPHDCCNFMAKQISTFTWLSTLTLRKHAVTGFVSVDVRQQKASDALQLLLEKKLPAAAALTPEGLFVAEITLAAVRGVSSGEDLGLSVEAFLDKHKPSHAKPVCLPASSSVYDALLMMYDKRLSHVWITGDEPPPTTPTAQQVPTFSKTGGLPYGLFTVSAMMQIVIENVNPIFL